MMKMKLLALALAAAGVAALCYAARGEGQHPIGVVAALAAFIAAASLISRVGGLAVKLRPFIGSTVTVRAWGNPLPNEQPFEVVSVSAIGAGLHLYLRPEGSASAVHLKIAQPRYAEVEALTARIRDAKYIQWAGKKLRPTDRSAPALVLETSRETAQSKKG